MNGKSDKKKQSRYEKGGISRKKGRRVGESEERWTPLLRAKHNLAKKKKKRSRKDIRSVKPGKLEAEDSSSDRAEKEDKWLVPK